MVTKSIQAGLAGLILTVATGPGTALPINVNPSADILKSATGVAATAVHYRAHKHGIKKHRRAGGPFILRRPEYGTLPYIYDRRARYPYHCVPRTAAQFHYCRERFITVDPVSGALVSYAPYGHLCYCR